MLGGRGSKRSLAMGNWEVECGQVQYSWVETRCQGAPADSTDGLQGAEPRRSGGAAASLEDDDLRLVG